MDQTVEKMTNENANTMGNQFFGNTPLDNSMDKECAIIGLIKNHILVLEEEYSAAKDEYATASLKERYSRKSYESEFQCRLFEAKLDILNKIKQDVENMLTPSFTIAN